MPIQHPTALVDSRRLLAAGVLLAALPFAAVAQADSIQKRLGIFDDVTVTGVEGGKLLFKNNTTKSLGECSLAEIQILKIDSVPVLRDAMELAQKKNDAAAAGKFGEALRVAQKLADAKQKAWLVPYIQFQLQACHVRLKEGLPAAKVYCDLLQSTTNGAYVSAESMPNALVKALDENSRKSLFEYAKAVRAKVPAGNQDLLANVVAATGITEAVPAPEKVPDPSAATPGTPGTSGTPGANLPQVKFPAGALKLPAFAVRFIQERGGESPDLKMAVAGDYSAAVKALEKALSTSAEGTSLRLLVLGRVYQELAAHESDASKKSNLQKEAAIHFARVASQFHDSASYEPSLLELARIHREWGRESTAQKIFSEIPATYGEGKDDRIYTDLYNAFKAATPANP